MIVRIARLEDCPRLVALQQQYWDFESLARQPDEWHTQAFRRFLADPHYGVILVAELLELGVIGYLVLCWQFSFEYGGLSATIDELFVASQARGQGIGQHLFVAGEQVVRDYGGMEIELEVDQHNRAAIEFYRKLGCTQRNKYLILTKSLG